VTVKLPAIYVVIATEMMDVAIVESSIESVIDKHLIPKEGYLREDQILKKS